MTPFTRTTTRGLAEGLRFRVPSGDTTLLNFEGKRKKCTSANQDVNDCLPRSSNSPISGSVGERYFFSDDLTKKAENHFLKKWKGPPGHKNDTKLLSLPVENVVDVFADESTQAKKLAIYPM